MQKVNNQVVEPSIGNYEFRNFFASSDEKILLTKRAHWLALFAPIVGVVLIYIPLFFFTLFIFNIFQLPFTLLLSTIFLILIAGASIITKLVVDWYCHFYVVTDRKILEVCYIPLFCHEINEVLLDQVNCTEIDVKTNGIINEIFDMGNVTVTFDRPTHQEEFIFANIQNPRSTGFFLTDFFDVEDHKYKPDIWVRTKEKKRPLRFMEEIFPKTLVKI